MVWALGELAVVLGWLLRSFAGSVALDPLIEAAAIGVVDSGAPVHALMIGVG